MAEIKQLEKEMTKLALAKGFSAAAVIDADELVYVAEYRKYCEENLCGNYGKLPVCPPACGTPDEMYARIIQYKKALVLQTEFTPNEQSMTEYARGKRLHNQLREKLLPELQLEDYLIMSAGPWKDCSCMSAYSIDATKMAESCGMICWGKDGIFRLFSTVLFARKD